MHEVLGEATRQRGVAFMNAAAVALGSLTTAVTARTDSTFMALSSVLAAVRRTAEECRSRDVDIAFLANQYTIQRSGAATTVIGTTRIDHLRSALAAADDPIDEELLAAVLGHRPAPETHQWDVGLPQEPLTR